MDTYARPEGKLGTAHFHVKVAHKGRELALFAAASSSVAWCRTAAPAPAPDASLYVAALLYKSWQWLDLNQRPKARETRWDVWHSTHTSIRLLALLSHLIPDYCLDYLSIWL